MADTGYNWDANWTLIRAAVALTQGGTISDVGESNEIDLDGKAACLISFDTDYSNDAKATAGLTASIRRDVDDTVWESINGASVAFEMPFTQNSTERKTIFLSAAEFQKFVIQLDWGNTTGGSVATTEINAKYATVPVAS